MKLYQLVALGLTILPTCAGAGEWQYNFEGFAKGLYGYTDTKKHNHGVVEANLSAFAEYNFDNQDVLGLNFEFIGGINKELQDYNQGRWGEEVYITYDSLFGQIMLGQVYNVASLFHNGAYTTGALKTPSDVVDFLSNPNWRRTSKQTVFATLNSTDINTDGVAPKINYISPEWKGTAIGFSYMPDSYNRRGLINKHAEYASDEGFVGAVYNDMDFNFFSTQSSFGYAQYHENDKEFSYSLRINKGNWHIGASYRKTYIDGDDKSNRPSEIPSDFDGYREGESWNVGVSFEFGPLQSSLDYFESSSDNTENKNKIIAFSNQYQINEHIDIYIAAAHTDYDNTSECSNGYAVISGIGVKF